MDNRVEYLGNDAHQYIGPVVCESNLTRFFLEPFRLFKNLIAGECNMIL